MEKNFKTQFLNKILKEEIKEIYNPKQKKKNPTRVHSGRHAKFMT
jgi:hypothetical protein